jgi:hypothetical protein
MANLRPLVINVPGIAETIVVPGLDSREMQADRARRFAYHAANNPLPELLQWVPQWITALDNAQDLLSTILVLGRPLWRRLPLSWLGPVEFALHVNDLLNTATSTLGAIASGRVPKLSYLTQQTQAGLNRPVLARQSSSWLAATLNPFAVAATAGQVLYDFTGYGLRLGGIMGFVTDVFWSGLRMLTTGRRPVIVLPPKDDLIWKAWNVLREAAGIVPVLPALTKSETIMAWAAQAAAFDIVSEPPAIPDQTINFGAIGYRRIHYDRHRDVVVDQYIQTASPFVDAMTEIPPDLPIDVTEYRDSYGNLPAVWPWNPVAAESLDVTGYRETTLKAYAEYYDRIQESYIQRILNSEWWRGPAPEETLADVAPIEVAGNVAYEHRGALTDYTTWLNGERELFSLIYQWDERALALAIEENIFPRLPYHAWNYCDCSEPFASPVALPLDMPAAKLIGAWLARARELWRNPGAPFWYPVTGPGSTVEWKVFPFLKRERAFGLIASSYECWGARYKRPPYNDFRAPITANWQLQEPFGIEYYAGTPDQRSRLRFKTLPSNEWIGCTPPLLTGPTSPQPPQMFGQT